MTLMTIRSVARPAVAVALMFGVGMVSACGSDPVRRTEETTTTTTAPPVAPAVPAVGSTQTTTTHTQGY